MGSEAQAQAFARQAGSPAKHIEKREPSLLKGTAQTVHAGLEALHQEFGIDEFIIDTPIAEHQSRVLSLRLLAGNRSTPAAFEVASEHEAW